MSAQPQYEAYVWAYFTGEGETGEQISLAVSNGNDALNWTPLNGGRPLFVSKYGTKGLRDPFIMRLEQGGGFAIVATDLNIHALEGSFGKAQRTGSRYLEIWRSPDLVHWGEQEHVLVDRADAGNTWAPEAIWDPSRGEYAVYWASNLYQGPAAADPSLREQCTYNRMMIARTKDFRTFSEPQVWVDVCSGNGHDGRGTIDVTVAHNTDEQGHNHWVRFIKDERTMTVREEVSDGLFATVSGALPGAAAKDNVGWHLVCENVGVGLPNGEIDPDTGEPKQFTQGEGPCIFPANPGDVNGYAWYLFIDQPRYHGGPNHYIGFATHNLMDPDGWEPISNKLREGIPTNADGGKPRHGTVMPITAAERDALLAAFR